MKEPVRVLHIMSSFGGGISSFIRNKAKAVDSSKVVFDIATFNDYPAEFAEEIKAMGGNIYHIPNPKKEGVNNFNQAYTNILKNHGPYDLVHSHVGGYRAFSFYLLTKKAGIKRFVVHAHSSEPYYFNGKSFKAKLKTKFEQRLNRMAATDLVSCGKNPSAFYFGEHAVKNKEVMHIPNSIDLDKYMVHYSEAELKAKKEALNIPPDRYIVGHVGRVDRNKNHAFLLEIIKKMKEQQLPFYWIFIGTGVLLDAIKAQVEEENLGDYVQVLGRREDVQTLYPLMDVFVLPSFSEGLPTVCVEAQASGTPCVVSDTITDEIDMELGMVSFEALTDPDGWIQAIEASVKKQIPSQSEIRQRLTEKKFSNAASADLYEAFILGEMDHYEL